MSQLKSCWLAFSLPLAKWIADWIFPLDKVIAAVAVDVIVSWSKQAGRRKETKMTMLSNAKMVKDKP